VVFSKPLHPCEFIRTHFVNDPKSNYHNRALPAFTIHTVVRQTTKAFANVKNVRVKTWGPTLTGLAVVPILPYLFDKPVEHVMDNAFHWIKKKLAENKVGTKVKEL